LTPLEYHPSILVPPVDGLGLGVLLLLKNHKKRRNQKLNLQLLFLLGLLFVEKMKLNYFLINFYPDLDYMINVAREKASASPPMVNSWLQLTALAE
jgi:hypothetical protein